MSNIGGQTVGYAPGDAVLMQLHEAQARIAALEAKLAELEASLQRGKNATVREILEAEHRVAVAESQLAKMSRWTRITSDKETWPPEHDFVLIFDPRPDLEPWLMRVWMQQYPSLETSQSFIGLYWQPITPPEDKA